MVILICDMVLNPNRCGHLTSRPVAHAGLRKPKTSRSRSRSRSAVCSATGFKVPADVLWFCQGCDQVSPGKGEEGQAAQCGPGFSYIVRSSAAGSVGSGTRKMILK
jgi:hypothetical protein